MGAVLGFYAEGRLARMDWENAVAYEESKTSLNRREALRLGAAGVFALAMPGVVTSARAASQAGGRKQDRSWCDDPEDAVSLRDRRGDLMTVRASALQLCHVASGLAEIPGKISLRVQGASSYNRPLRKYQILPVGTERRRTAPT